MNKTLIEELVPHLPEGADKIIIKGKDSDEIFFSHDLDMKTLEETQGFPPAIRISPAGNPAFYGRKYRYRLWKQEK